MHKFYKHVIIWNRQCKFVQMTRCIALDKSSHLYFYGWLTPVTFLDNQHQLPLWMIDTNMLPFWIINTSYLCEWLTLMLPFWMTNILVTILSWWSTPVIFPDDKHLYLPFWKIDTRYLSRWSAGYFFRRRHHRDLWRPWSTLSKNGWCFRGDLLGLPPWSLLFGGQYWFFYIF